MYMDMVTFIENLHDWTHKFTNPNWTHSHTHSVTQASWSYHLVFVFFYSYKIQYKYHSHIVCQYAGTTVDHESAIFLKASSASSDLIDLMHWRHVSITTTPCWGSRLVALRAHVLLAERIGAHPLSQCAHPGQLGGEACRGLPSECMLGDGARGVPRLTPNTTGAPFCDVICIWSTLTA